MDSKQKELKYTVKDFYKLYKQERKNWEWIPSLKLYISVARFLLQRVNEAMVTKRLRLKVPYGLGEFLICEATGAGKRYGKDLKQGRKYANMDKIAGNFHTLGKVFKWHWEKRKVTNIYFKNWYIYEPVRRSDNGKLIGRRGLGKHIISCSKDPNVPDFKPSY